MPLLIHNITGPQDSGGLLIWGRVSHFYQWEKEDQGLVEAVRFVFLQQPLGFGELNKQVLPSRPHLTGPWVG